jgi:ATP-dependent DNA helicase DinG
MVRTGILFIVAGDPEEKCEWVWVGEDGVSTAGAERGPSKSAALEAERGGSIVVTLGAVMEKGFPAAVVRAEDLLWVLAPETARQGAAWVRAGLEQQEGIAARAWSRLVALTRRARGGEWWKDAMKCVEAATERGPASDDEAAGWAFCAALEVLSRAAAKPEVACEAEWVEGRGQALPVLERSDLERDEGALLEEAFEERLPRLLGEAYEAREAQHELARAVLEVLQNGGRLLAEAGTGIGKTFAYGFPAALVALRRQRPVLVSTYTKNLQQQLRGDFDTVRAALGLSAAELAVETLYGRQNYLCGARLREVHPSRMRLVTPALYAGWLVLGGLDRSGDPDVGARLPGGLAERFRLLGPLHRDVLARRVVCERDACARVSSCAYQQALRRAQKAHVVLCNHALLLQSGAPFLGASRVIIDEAHSFAEAATGAFSLEVSSRNVAEPMAFLMEQPGAALPLESRAQPEQARAVLTPLRKEAKSLEREMKTVARALRETGAGTSATRFDLEGTEWGYAAARVQSLAEQCRRLGGKAREAADRLKKQQATETSETLGGLAERAAQLADDLAAILADAEGYVRLATCAGDGWTLQQMLLFPGEALSERFLAHYESVVFSSASLSVAGEFGFAEAQLGAGKEDPGVWRRLSLPSPFDYERRAGLVVPTDEEFHYRWETRAEFYRAVAGALRGMVPSAARSGGVLVLFTNKEEMNRAYEELAEPLAREGVRVLRQEEGGRGEAEQAFRAQRGSVLFGLRSYFSGADFPGEQLVCVVLVKLPFRSPSDPTEAERAEAMKARGEDHFRAYALPTAALDFRQCFGRLIRTRDDYGLVVVLDRRLGRFPEFWASVPRCRLFRGPMERVAAEALDFLERCAEVKRG